jgi:predicted nucleotidyltransferase
MTDERIREVMESFASQAKSVYGTKLHQIVLYGSCARGDYQQDSDIDVMLLLNVGQDQLAEERKKVFDIADEIDLKYDVVLTPVLQSMDIYNKFLGVSMFFQNIEKEGIRYA